MLSCVRCGLCLTSCPTYVLSGHEAEGPRGRIAMLRGLVEGRLQLTPDLAAHELNSLVCNACSAGTHPGGAVMGAPGHNAAQAVLADRASLFGSPRP